VPLDAWHTLFLPGFHPKHNPHLKLVKLFGFIGATT
jgi:hypothetical protein